MVLIKLAVILAVIVAILCFRKPLYIAIIAGIVVSVALFGIDISTSLSLVWRGFSNPETLTVLAGLYTITYLQRMLEKRDQLRMAQKDLDDIFHNRRINASLAPIFIGLLPSAAAVNICAEIVENATGDCLDKDEKSFVTSYFRHIPESFLPTYPSVLLLVGLSGVAMSGFVVGMLPLVVALFALGYVFYLRKVPKKYDGVEADTSVSKGKAWLSLLSHLWPLFLIVVLIIALNMEIYIAVAISIVLTAIVYRFKGKELGRFVVTAFEFQMLLNSALVMVFREFIQESGAMAALPEALSFLPIPLPIIFALIFFIGALMIGNNAIVAMTTTLAFTTVPDGGLPFAILLMAFTYAAMQLSPTHYCIFVALDYFKADFVGIVKKTVLPILCFLVITVLYYLLLAAIF